jgi:hypothetical protein
MSSVPKNRRRVSPFQTPIEILKLRNEVTALIARDFGFSERRFKKQLQEIRRQNINSVCDIDEFMVETEAKLRDFYKWYISEEKAYVLNMMKSIQSEFRQANSIYPSDKTFACKEEYIERRMHLNRAICSCQELIGELQYIATSVPSNLNQYVNLDEQIQKVMSMIKGVRSSDNRFNAVIKKQINEYNLNNFDAHCNNNLNY